MMNTRLLLIPTIALFYFDSIRAFSNTNWSRCATVTSTTFRRQSQLRASTSDYNDDVIHTVQILMSDTGGGHRASANALRDAFDVLHPGKIQVDIVDIYTEYGPFWPYNDYVEMYKRLAANPISWDAFYQFGASDVGMYVNELLLDTFCFDAFTQCLQRHVGTTGKRADLVVSVHPLCQDLPLRILSYLDSNKQTRDYKYRKTPFCTVVTDLGSAHPTWFHPSVDQCFVPSDALRAVARKQGLNGSQIIQHGLPIRKGFWFEATESREAVRAKLGLDMHAPTCLVVGGGDGMGGIVEIAQRLGGDFGKLEHQTQLVIICGKNEKAKRALDRSTFASNVNVRVKGFVNNMDDWMRGSDVLVTKAGPGTIAEASICGLPCMMFSFLPGQEEGNVPFVEDFGFGKYSSEPEVISSTVVSWLSSPSALRSMKKAALSVARPQATLDIARDLAEIVFATNKRTENKVIIKVKERSAAPQLVG